EVAADQAARHDQKIAYGVIDTDGPSSLTFIGEIDDERLPRWLSKLANAPGDKCSDQRGERMRQAHGQRREREEDEGERHEWTPPDTVRDLARRHVERDGEALLNGE